MIPGMKKEQQETEVYAAALPLSSAVRTGLEPATPCVTGMYSNQAELPHLEIMIANVPKQNSFPFAVAKLQPFFLPTKFFAIFFHIFLSFPYPHSPYIPDYQKFTDCIFFVQQLQFGELRFIS